MIIYKSRFLTRAEVWYDSKPDFSRTIDWILYQQCSRPVAGTRATDYYTYAIDLSLSSEQLLANLNKDTAYKIRRARERDNIICECCDANNAVHMDDFEAMYNDFAAMKGRQPLNRLRMECMAEAGALDLSVARDSRGTALVYHANYHTPNRATSLELPSLYRKFAVNSERSLISRANRYLTWTNLLRYRSQGLKTFDFGGWYPGNGDQERLDINRFKEGFGGMVVREYQCEQILTMRGRLVLGGAVLFGQAKSLRLNLKKPATHHPGLLSSEISVSAD